MPRRRQKDQDTDTATNRTLDIITLPFFGKGDVSNFNPCREYKQKLPTEIRNDRTVIESTQGCTKAWFNGSESNPLDCEEEKRTEDHVGP